MLVDILDVVAVKSYTHAADEDCVILCDVSISVAVPEYLWLVLVIELIELCIFFDGPSDWGVLSLWLSHHNTHFIGAASSPHLLYPCLLLFWVDNEAKLHHLYLFLVKWGVPNAVMVPEEDAIGVHGESIETLTKLRVVLRQETNGVHGLNLLFKEAGKAFRWFIINILRSFLIVN